jgi:hypothetical protein
MRKRASPVMPYEKSQSRRSPKVFFWSSDMMEKTSASHCSAVSGWDSCAMSLPRTRNMGGRPTWMCTSVAFMSIASRRTCSSWTTAVSFMQ